MKLLLDENLSRRIVPALQTAYPGSTQVALVGLEHANDREIWVFAKDRGFTIVTKDDDFLGLLALMGHPPKVALLSLGNSTNAQRCPYPLACGTRRNAGEEQHWFGGDILKHDACVFLACSSWKSATRRRLANS